MATGKSPAAKAAKVVSDATETLEKTATDAGQAMKDNVSRAMDAAADLSAFGKGNLEAWMASAAATQKGAEALSARAVAFSKHALESHAAAARALLASRSVHEVVEKQTEYARAVFDDYVAELSTMSDLMAGYAKDAMRPLNERVSAVSTIMQNGRLR